MASGDNSGMAATSPRYVESSELGEDPMLSNEHNDKHVDGEQNIPPQTIDENEAKLKQRIDHCKKIVEALKLQITEEKEKLQDENNAQPCGTTNNLSGDYDTRVSRHDTAMEDYGNSSMYSASVDNKLHCDESLIEYEKQLQKYQYTLQMAQNEKKNAIRKKMLVKAFKLKLMEIENQCNIEILRLKQSLQCLEPLEMMVNKWKLGTENNTSDTNNYELMPSFLELKAQSGSDVNRYIGEFDTKPANKPCNSKGD